MTQSRSSRQGACLTRAVRQYLPGRPCWHESTQHRSVLGSLVGYRRHHLGLVTLRRQRRRKGNGTGLLDGRSGDFIDLRW